MTHHPLDHPEPHPHATPHPHGVGHIVSPKILIATAVALLILTVVTVAVAEIDFAQMDLPELNIFIALLVAAAKASLVCLFFMHLKWDRPFNSLVLVASLAGVALFIAFALTDTSEYQHEVIYGESNLIRSRIPTPDQLAAPAAPPAAPQGDAAGATAP